MARSRSSRQSRGKGSELIAPSALRYSRAFLFFFFFSARTEPGEAEKFVRSESSLWEERSAGQRGGLQRLISPDAPLLRGGRRKPAARSIREESASSGLPSQSAVVAVVPPEDG